MSGRHRRPSRTVKVINRVSGVAGAGITAGTLITGAAQAQTVPAVPHHAVTGTASIEAVSQPAAREITQSPRVVTVKPGDYLSKLAGEYCGNPADWTGWWNYNHKTLHWTSPDVIQVGDRVIPDCRVEKVWLPQVITSPPARPYTAPYRPVTVTSYSGGGNLSFSGLEALWESAGGPGWAAWSAATIAECESGGQQYAYNPSGASGYWQILGEVIPGNVYDPMVNAENAVAKFRASGDTFAQWVCRA